MALVAFKVIGGPGSVWNAVGAYFLIAMITGIAVPSAPRSESETTATSALRRKLLGWSGCMAAVGVFAVLNGDPAFGLVLAGFAALVATISGLGPVASSSNLTSVPQAAAPRLVPSTQQIA